MAFFIILIVFLGLWLLWPWISRQISRYMARRAEDMIRRMTGMPPRQEEKKRRASSRGGESGYAGRSRRRPRSYQASPEEVHRAMREYAVDVEYTEIREFSDSILFEEDKKQRHIKTEEQISDAEYVIIKDSHA